MTAGDFSGVSEATAFRIIETVTEAISHLKDRFVKMPSTPEEMAQASTLFSRMARFPRVIGVVDGTHIRMQSPGGPGAEIYRNRKGYFSKNVQVVAGPNLEILDVVSRWQGAAHDQTIFNVSDVQRRFENGEFGNYLLLGDSGYECRQYLMPPLRQVRNPAENLYNESLIRTRQSVERLFGVWKRRFPILSLGIRVTQRKIVKADFYIVACAILHNIACKNREEDPPVEVPGPAEDNIDEPQRVVLPVVREMENNARYQARRDLINGWFAQMVE
uniref:Nuclease HARBI1 n=3 Tax=Cacopsylla melanoneura TaxID=428564 RepID=A0A8D8QGY3_9HEMI